MTDSEKSSVFVIDSKLQLKPALKRQFGIFAGCSMVAASMIGSGIFISPGIVLKNVGSFWVSIAIWIVTGLVALTGALCYLELALLIPKTGGPYHYLNQGLGNFVGYAYIWMNAVFTRPASMAVAALSFGLYVVPERANLIAITLVMIWSATVFISTRLSKQIIKLCTVIKVLGLIVIVICGLVLFIENDFQFQGGLDYKSAEISSDTLLAVWTTAAFSAFWSYDGWDILSYITEEVHDPDRTFPIVTWTVTPCVILLYVVVNLAYEVALTPQKIAESDALVADFGFQVAGDAGRIAMIAIVCTSTFGSGMATALTSSRLSYGAAIDDANTGIKGVLWRPIGFLHIDRNTPLVAIILNGGIAVLLLLVLTSFESVSSAYGWAAWFFQMLIFCSVITLRYVKSDFKRAKRSYQVPIVFPVINIFVALSLVLFPIIGLEYSTFVISGVLFAVGLIFYFWEQPLGETINNRIICLVQKVLSVA